MSSESERVAAVWRERAIRLAQPASPELPAQAPLPALLFRLGAERCAIELKDLSEVLALSRCARVPGSSAHFAGVMAVRGELWPLLDLARFLGIADTRTSEYASVLILRRRLGLKIDRVEEVIDIRPEGLVAPANSRHAKGMTAGMVTLLSADAILADVFPGTGREQDEEKLSIA